MVVFCIFWPIIWRLIALAALIAAAVGVMYPIANCLEKGSSWIEHRVGGSFGTWLSIVLFVFVGLSVWLPLLMVVVVAMHGVFIGLKS